MASGKRGDGGAQASSLPRKGSPAAQCGHPRKSLAESTQVSLGPAQTAVGGSCSRCCYRQLVRAGWGWCALTDCYTPCTCVTGPKQRWEKRGKGRRFSCCCSRFLWEPATATLPTLLGKGRESDSTRARTWDQGEENLAPRVAGVMGTPPLPGEGRLPTCRQEALGSTKAKAPQATQRHVRVPTGIGHQWAATRSSGWSCCLPIVVAPTWQIKIAGRTLQDVAFLNNKLV